MAQQGRNDNTYGFDELAFWRPIDAENRPVYRAVLRESRAIQDEAQDILNRFAGLSMMGLLPKAQVERLHRDIVRWKKQGESIGELRLLMQDAQHRTRIRCDEAMLLYLMHVISDSYAKISEIDRDALLSASRIAYKRAFAEGNEITRLGTKNTPGAKFVRDTLSNNPLPTGLTYEQALAADAAYRAREITKQAVVDSSQGKELSMDSEPMQAILRRQRAWQLREVQKTPEGRFAGYYDMVMGFIVGHTVVQAFIDAGVKAYRFIATIDDRTTSECRALHGKVFRMEELKLGINAPPVYPPPHPCRSVIQAVEVDAPQFTSAFGRGIINPRGDGVGIDIEIDRFTPCLLDTETNELVETEYKLVTASELKGLKANGWLFNWRGKDLSNSEIYKLTLQGDDEIQGLVAVESREENLAYHLSLVESAPENRLGRHYEGVGGHLFAIAAKKSLEAGYGGFIFFEAKNIELVNHYQTRFGATWIGRPHEYSMIIDEKAAQELLDNYTLNGGD